MMGRKHKEFWSDEFGRWQPFRVAMLASLAHILNTNVDRLPQVFRAPTRPKALMLGIDKALHLAYPESDHRQIDEWMQLWCSHRAYLLRLMFGRCRHDLNGEDAEEITAFQRSSAFKRFGWKPPKNGLVEASPAADGDRSDDRGVLAGGAPSKPQAAA